MSTKRRDRAPPRHPAEIAGPPKAATEDAGNAGGIGTPGRLDHHPADPGLPRRAGARGRGALAAAWLAAAAPAALAGAALPPGTVPLAAKSPHGGFNRLTVSVTVCEPGSARCAVVPDVMVDTGSVGLRLEPGALPDGMRLPPVIGRDGRPLAECVRFVHDQAWGPVVRADVVLGGLRIAGLPLQRVDDRDPSRPASCPASGAVPTSNGTLGVAQYLTDCPGACRQSAAAATVYACEAGRCAPLAGAVDLADRLPNPAALLPGRGDGITFDLPAAPGGGSREIVGTLTFGVDAEALRGAGLLRLDDQGRFATLYRGRIYPRSIIDSGTETFLVPDADLPPCRARDGTVCAAPERRLVAVMVGRDGARLPVALTVGDDAGERARRVGASSGRAVAVAPSAEGFVWGAPFFFGRRVTLVFEGRAVSDAPGVSGPLYAIGAGARRRR